MYGQRPAAGGAHCADGPPHAALCPAGAVLDAELPDAGSEGGDEPREEIGEDEAAEILEAMLGMAPPPAAEPPPKKQRRVKVSWGFGRPGSRIMLGHAGRSNVGAPENHPKSPIRHGPGSPQTLRDWS